MYRTRSSFFRFSGYTSMTLMTMLVVIACSNTKTDSAGGSATMSADTGTATAARADTGMAGMDHSTMEAMTGNADQDFLRMMSDHHKGLIELAHMTKDGKGSTEAVRADARKLDTAQDAELDSMTTILETTFKDPYTPKVTSKGQAMLDSLRARRGAAYDRTFYQQVIAHHREGVTMMDQYLPKLTRPEIKAMTQRMRDVQSREITEFEQKVNASK